MPKIEEARAFLEEVGMPKAQQADICCLTLLAMADLKPEDGWAKATNHWIRIHDVIAFANEHYATTYAENSRETFRKQAMHHFRTAALIEDNGKATNSPNYRYRITEEVLSMLRGYGTFKWRDNIRRYNLYHEKLIDTCTHRKRRCK